MVRKWRPKAPPGDAKCVAEIFGDTNKEVRGGIYLFVSREYKRIKLIKLSNKCVDAYV